MIICSFCHRDQDDIRRLLSTPSHYTYKAYICDQCIKTCHSIIINEETEQTKQQVNKITPADIKNHADQYVIGQDNAKKVLSVAVYNHYKNFNNKGKTGTVLEKSNILLAGPSGVGKTHLVKTIASYLNLPVAMADATGLTEAGYVGEDAESMIERLIQNAGGDIALAQHGIIYIDEIDKKVSKVSANSTSRDVSGAGVQQGLLKIVEGTIVKVPSPNRHTTETVDFDTKDVLFICGGTFIGIEKIIRKDDVNSGIGFSSAPSKNIDDLIALMKPQHLIEYGMIP